VILYLVAGVVKRPDLRARRGSETERRIVQAATVLFTARGYAGTSLSQVAAAAGVAAGVALARTHRQTVGRVQLALEQVLDRLEHGDVRRYVR